MLQRSARSLVVLALAALTMLGGPAQASTATTTRVVIADGHVDIGPRYVAGEWRTEVRDDTVHPAVWRRLGEVVLHVRDAAITPVPAPEAYRFLGPAGAPIHLLPQSQRPGLVWPGWSAQEAAVLASVSGPVTFGLESVEGPGDFALYSIDSFGDIDVFFDSNRPYPQAVSVPLGAHVHGAWAFSQPGVYRLGIDMRARLTTGESVSSPATLVVAVGDDVDPSAIPPDAEVPPAEGGDGISITTRLQEEAVVPPSTEPVDPSVPVGPTDPTGPGDPSGPGGSGGSGGSGSSGLGAGSSGTEGPGRLARTGASIDLLLLVAVGLVLGGLALMGGRRALRVRAAGGVDAGPPTARD